MKPRCLVIAPHGQVGFEAVRALSPHWDIVTAARQRADHVADLDQPATLAGLVERIAPAVVVNAAAWTAVDRAEAEPEAAWRANAEAPGALARGCAAVGALLVHYSTDYVFDGSGEAPRDEDAATAPRSSYGKSKWAGEQAVRDSGCAHLILRTQWVYAARGQNFLRTMLKLAGRESLAIVDDQYGAPTPARWLGAALAPLLERARASAAPPRATYHLVAGGETHWLSFAEAIFDGALRRGLIERRPLLQPVSTEAYGAPAPRPKNGRLSGARLAAAYGIGLPDWRGGLAQVLDELAR
ncbi:MAG: dTDP-4-dehydrorhamnose reductase [Xanthomonadales bacterium]|jgi:dTDP-4-dehydrorhamnose reductase|nr:dTDP-4-dehydrorhamnose reductase [Xanthomonadales bacterium]